MRFLFIDIIEAITKDKNIVALKHVSLSEDYFTNHFPGNPVMPGSLIIETMAQAGTALVEISRALSVKAIPIIVEQVKFRELIKPGDVLKITMTLEADRGETVKIVGNVKRNDNIVVTGSFVFIVKDADEFYTPMAKVFMENHYSKLTENAETIGFGEKGNHNG